MTRRAGTFFDPFLASYIATVRAVLEPLVDRSTIDIAAGSQWVRHLGFERYVPLDIVEPSEIWDIDTPLALHHHGRYDLALCMGALHYSFDPHASLDEFCRTLVDDGDLVMMVPWLYPPHDRLADRWRISPRQIFSMLDRRFDRVDLWFVGNVVQVPFHVAKRWVAGPFAGLDGSSLEKVSRRRAAPRLRPTSVDDVPVRWTGPLNVVAHAQSYMRSQPAP